ncbi:hypothetical protein SteCoe_14725 [Stentor coeruleus]|uniref:Defective in cullin neddylation protein n=1 Tax=Stentor coeruleus TaxID=5963 RepID=A0A1R2C570_9CILI|nr:hypothetical protein SteCoe_14725 [Stentor coeruleus]
MSLNAKQREKLSQFREITGLNEKEAKLCLAHTNWNLEGAIEYFFSQEAQPSSSSSQQPTKADLLDGLYNKYKSPNSIDIEAEGIQSFCQDLGIDPLDPVTLVFAYYCKAEVMGVFKKEEFIQGLKALGCDSIQKLKNKLPDMRIVLADTKQFKEIYNYVFGFSREAGCRNLSIDVAIALWRLLLGAKFPMVETWITFLESRGKRHDVSKDTWEMLLDFLEIVQKEGLQGYDPNSAWPVLIDEFVEFLSKSS